MGPEGGERGKGRDQAKGKTNDCGEVLGYSREKEGLRHKALRQFLKSAEEGEGVEGFQSGHAIPADLWAG